MPLLLRPALETDVPRIHGLAHQIWHACYADLLSVAQRNYMLAWMYAPHKLAAEIRRGVNYRIAEWDGEPVGYLAWEPLGDGETAHLHKLYLQPECHGRGWGQRMLGEVLTAAATAGLRVLELRVNKGNARALRAYQRAGFVQTGEVATDIGGGFVMDDFILHRPIQVTEPRFVAQTDTGSLPSE